MRPSQSPCLCTPVTIETQQDAQSILTYTQAIGYKGVQLSHYSCNDKRNKKQHLAEFFKGSG